MDNAMLMDSFEQLKGLYQKQVEMFQSDDHEETMDAVFQIESEKQHYLTLIDQIKASSNHYEALDAVMQRELLTYVQDIQKLHTRLETMLLERYDENSKTRKQVSVHRKTLQTYGGVNNSDVVSFYFDEKK